MEAKDYLKSKKIWLGTQVADMNAPENYFELEHLLEDYHQAKLKLLDIPAVINRRELLLAFLQYLDENKPQTWFTHEPIVNDFLSKQ